MDKRLLYISEEHIGREASASDAHRVIDLLRANEWTAVYGDHPWAFDDEAQRATFEKAFEWALAVVAAEKQPYEETTWIDLARQRVQLNEQLRPFDKQLLELRPNWIGYFRWLIETPTEVILSWLNIKKEDVSKD